MEVLENNIYPIFDRMLGREDKEALLGQRGVRRLYCTPYI